MDDESGNLNGGSISGLAVSGNNVYVSGTTSNGSLTAGGQATVANASDGGMDAFVFGATDNGATATANTVSYVSAPGGSTTAGNVTVGPDGTVYLAGTTTGTFAGQSRSVQNVNNEFVTALSGSGAIDWTRQFGGADGQSTGASVAVDPTGSSVLTALGLPSGAVNVNQSVDLTADTTLRAGNSFQLQTEGTGGRTSTITISQGETLQDLAVSINAELLGAGKATVSFSSTGAQTLEITASAGQTINVKAGPANSDALGRLGITPGVITASAKKGSSSSSTTGTSFGVTKSSSSSGASSTAKPVDRPRPQYADRSFEQRRRRRGESLAAECHDGDHQRLSADEHAGLFDVVDADRAAVETNAAAFHPCTAAGELFAGAGHARLDEFAVDHVDPGEFDRHLDIVAAVGARLRLATR